MSFTARDLRGTLWSSDTEFRRLAAEHSRYEAELEQLLKQNYRNSEDLTQEVELKKLKLRVKDRMEQLVARYISEPTHH